MGALAQKDRSMDDVERFLSLLRFDSMAKAEELLIEADPEQEKVSF
ncbi:MAG: hypothetical protein ISR58_13435 [Anaerolineales bacterium]|nr:hypothetical protein [Anaerolineales bacterium]